MQHVIAHYAKSRLGRVRLFTNLIFVVERLKRGLPAVQGFPVQSRCYEFKELCPRSAKKFRDAKRPGLFPSYKNATFLTVRTIVLTFRW